MDKLLPNNKHNVYYISPPEDNTGIQLNKFLCTGDRCRLETKYNDIPDLKIKREKKAPILSLNIDNTKKPQYVVFNAGTTKSTEKIKYFLENIYLVSPSIHTINKDQSMAGEVILVHKSHEGQYLYLCILLEEGVQTKDQDIQYKLFNEISKCMPRRIKTKKQTYHFKNTICGNVDSYSPNDLLPSQDKRTFALYLTNTSNRILTQVKPKSIYDKDGLFCVVVFTTPVKVHKQYINSFKNDIYIPGSNNNYQSIVAEKPIIRPNINYYMYEKVDNYYTDNSIIKAKKFNTLKEYKEKMCKSLEKSDKSDKTDKSDISISDVKTDDTKKEEKKEEKKEDKKEDKKEPKKTTKWKNIIIGIIIAIFVISYGYYLYKCITNMSKPKTFKNVAECFFTALVIIFKKIFDFFSSVSEKIKTNIPVNSQSAAAAASESAVDLVTNNPPVQPVNPLAHSAVSIP